MTSQIGHTIKKKTTVREHLRQSKNGNISSVKMHLRNIDVHLNILQQERANLEAKLSNMIDRDSDKRLEAGDEIFTKQELNEIDTDNSNELKLLPTYNVSDSNKLNKLITNKMDEMGLAQDWRGLLKYLKSYLGNYREGTANDKKMFYWIFNHESEDGGVYPAIWMFDSDKPFVYTGGIRVIEPDKITEDPFMFGEDEFFKSHRDLYSYAREQLYNTLIDTDEELLNINTFSQQINVKQPQYSDPDFKKVTEDPDFAKAIELDNNVGNGLSPEDVSKIFVIGDY